MALNKTAKLILAVIICQLAGVLGSLFTSPSIQTWYASINRSALSPPNWVFAPVWITLFLLMGISLYLIWASKDNSIDNKLIVKKSRLKNKLVIKASINPLKKAALIFFSIQLALNILWSIIFFGLHNIWLAFLEIILLWAFILLTIIKFYKISKPAAYLLVPYFLWVSFAAVLNLSLWMANA